MIKNVSVARAAILMGKGQMFIREGIRRGTLPFGTYVKGKGRDSFHISPKLFSEYMGVSISDL